MRVDTITYAARDGTAIPAVRSRPLTGDGPFPTVIMPHGGPVARSYERFKPLTALLAARGIQVIEPNFRGSEGYGFQWEAAGYNQWGGLMQRDIEDAAEWARNTHGAKRVCIAGGSFGGYAALLGAAQRPDLFDCASALNPVVDVALLVKNLRLNRFWQLFVPRIEESGGGDLASVSPITMVDRIRMPVQLFHATRDASVSFEQSVKMAEALTAAGVESEFHVLDGADHAVVDGDGRGLYFSELTAFLTRHLLTPRSAAGGEDVDAAL